MTNVCVFLENSDKEKKFLQVLHLDSRIDTCSYEDMDNFVLDSFEESGLDLTKLSWEQNY